MVKGIEMLRVAAVSDLHGILPTIPECDLLLIAGDICPAWDHSLRIQRVWLDTTFRRWLKSVPVKQQIVGVAGNHDMIYQQWPEGVPEELPWVYLQDAVTEVAGLKIFGAPWQLPFGLGWAFNLPENTLARKYELIPDDTDVIVTHGPPFGYGDAVPRRLNNSNETEWPEPNHQGSIALTKRIEEIKPKLVVTGHIHESHGQWQFGNTKIVNAAILDGQYHHVHQPTVIDLDV